MKIARLSGCKNFVGKREKFIFDAFVDLQPVGRFKNGSDTALCNSKGKGKGKCIYIAHFL